jgi:pseudomonalisin
MHVSPDSRSEPFLDITTGNNGNGVGPGYNATTGWDYTTGWGTPNGAQLVSLFGNN